MSHSTAWWPTVLVLGIACFTGIRSRRIPNWLVLPFGLAGLIVSILSRGVAGRENSLAGVGLAALVCGIFCYFRGLGIGDLKLSAAIGAWIGPAQPRFAWSGSFGAGVLIGMLGELYTNCSLRSPASAGGLLASFGPCGLRPHQKLALDNPAAIKIPYAPAIAIGTQASFLGW
jgi:prepilin peptidase CpaA